MEKNEKLKRNNKLNINEFALSSPYKMFICLRDQGLTFESDTYRNDYLGHCISKSNYDEIITDAGKLIEKSYLKKRLNEKINHPLIIIIITIVSIFFSLIFMILLYLSTSPNVNYGREMQVISIICISIAFISSFGIAIYNFFRQTKKFKSIGSIMYEEMTQYFVNVNSKYSNILNFTYNPNKYWIECHILQVNEKSKNFQNFEEYIEREENIFKNEIIKNSDKIMCNSTKLLNPLNGYKVDKITNRRVKS